MTEEFLNDEQTVEGAEELTIADRVIPIEEACTYKTVEASKMVMKLLGLIDLESILPKVVAVQKAGGDSAVLVVLAQKVLPMIADDVPEALLDLAALMVAPNNEMKQLYRKPNGITGLIRTNKEWLLFDAPPEASLQIITAFLPHLGLDRLKNVWNPLVKAMSGMLGVTETVGEDS